MSISLDAVLRALSDERRRCALSVLRRHRSLALSDLADELAIEEANAPLAQIPPDAVEQLYVDLYHRQIPVLEGAELVHYDQDRDLVEVTELGTGVVETVHRELVAEIE